MRALSVAVLTAAILTVADETARAIPSVSPTVSDFGSQAVGTAGAPETFVLTAYCNFPEGGLCNAWDILPTAISASGPFEVQEETCPEILMSPTITGESCLIRVVFRPTAAGPATGTLSTGGPTAELLGTGVESPVAGGSAQSGGGSGGAGPSPSNLFSFGRVKLDRTRGTATLAVEVPGPGTLALGGKGVAAPRPGGPTTSAGVIVNAAGEVKLAIRAAGRAKAKLEKTGRATVDAAVTFTPSGGAAATQTRRIHLRRTSRPGRR